MSAVSPIWWRRDSASPKMAALLVYLDRSRERRVSLIFPNMASARARADAIIRMRRTRRRDLVLLPLAEALS